MAACNTAKSWISVLGASDLILLLPPRHCNLGKRLAKTPKLFFLDTGLAGVRRAEDVGFSAMHRPLFETWAISEILKRLRNFVLPQTLHFWRDAHGKEVGVLVELASEEIFGPKCKAGQTVASDWFKILDEFCGLHTCSGSAILYGGEARQPQTASPVYAWRSVAKLLARVFGTAPMARK